MEERQKECKRETETERERILNRKKGEINRLRQRKIEREE